MSLYARELGSIPEETARVARAACPKGTLAMRLRDELGELYQDEHFTPLYPVAGQPAYEPWRLAIITVLQYAEGLTDRQAANAVRERIDWKYTLGLELTDPGFDFSVLSEFRARLIESQQETLLLDRLLEVCKQRGWLKAGGKQRTDSTHVLARVRSLCNLECVGETLRAVLDELATLAPDWLVHHISLDWFERYSHRVENYRLPKSESQRTALAQQIGADGLYLLHLLEKPDAPAILKNETCVHLLRQVWQQYYDLAGGKAKWRAGPQENTEEGIIRSPYDPQARTGKKRETVWLGYKVHLTETCDLEASTHAQEQVFPQLITAVQTTVATVQDVEMTQVIQEDLAHHDLLPEEQIVDTGYVDAELLVSSQENYGIRLLGPVLSDNSWQAKAGKGFDVGSFHLDWQAKLATCPQGQTSSRWSQAGERMEVVFARETCAACPIRSDCTKSATTGRVVHVRPQAAHEALQARRHEQETPEFRQAYQIRAGIEGTLSQAVRGMGIRRARYDGLHKTLVQHVVTAVAINLVRIDAALTSIPRGKTRQSCFMRLALHPALQRPGAA
ncbi:MAG: IS1182 family transposase [Ktedonobacteraceae bacterium]|nr:IS1182 family transposase [Ktedonobacteraceae bacterium]